MMTNEQRAEVERIRAIATQTIMESHAIATAAVDRMSALAELTIAHHRLLIEIIFACGDPRTCEAVLGHLRAMADQFEEFAPQQRVH